MSHLSSRMVEVLDAANLGLAYRTHRGTDRAIIGGLNVRVDATINALTRQQLLVLVDHWPGPAATAAPNVRACDWWTPTALGTSVLAELGLLRDTGKPDPPTPGTPPESGTPKPRSTR